MNRPALRIASSSARPQSDGRRMRAGGEEQQQRQARDEQRRRLPSAGASRGHARAPGERHAEVEQRERRVEDDAARQGDRPSGASPTTTASAATAKNAATKYSAGLARGERAPRDHREHDEQRARTAPAARPPPARCARSPGTRTAGRARHRRARAPSPANGRRSAVGDQRRERIEGRKHDRERHDHAPAAGRVRRREPDGEDEHASPSRRSRAGDRPRRAIGRQPTVTATIRSRNPNSRPVCAP